MRKSFALFVLFIVVVALVCPELNWNGIDLVVTCGAKEDMGWLSFLITPARFNNPSAYNLLAVLAITYSTGVFI